MGWLEKRRMRQKSRVLKEFHENVTGTKISNEEWRVIEQETAWWRATQEVQRVGPEPPATHLHEFPWAASYRVVFRGLRGEEIVEPGTWPATNEGYAKAKSRALRILLLTCARERWGGGSAYVWLTDHDGDWLTWVFCAGLGSNGLHISDDSVDIGDVDVDMANEFGRLYFIARSLPGLSQRYGFG